MWYTIAAQYAARTENLEHSYIRILYDFQFHDCTICYRS